MPVLPAKVRPPVSAETGATHLAFRALMINKPGACHGYPKTYGRDATSSI